MGFWRLEVVAVMGLQRSRGCSEVSVPGPRHLMGVHPASPSLWRCPCPIPAAWRRSSVTSEVSVPHFMGFTQRLHPFGDVPARFPLPREVPVSPQRCLSLISWGSSNIFTLWRCPCPTSILLERSFCPLRHLWRSLLPISDVPWDFRQRLCPFGDVPVRFPPPGEGLGGVPVTLKMSVPNLRHFHPFGDVPAPPWWHL